MADNESSRSGSTQTTTDHDVIRKWVEERDGWPASVKGTEEGDEAGVLRIDFPGYSEGRLERISWDEFFQKFDEKKLVFMYQNETRAGKESRFFKFVSQDTAREVNT